MIGMFDTLGIHSRFKKKTQQRQEDNLLMEGMRLQTGTVGKQENRLYTLLLKGCIVYLIVMGAMGCYLSCVDISYSWFVVHLVVLATSLFCATLYYSKRWENIGYFLLFLVMLFLGMRLRIYINSGFYAVANDLADQASGFFDSNAMRSYGEQVENRFLAVTVAMSFVGAVCCVPVNVLISRRMRYLSVAIVSIGVLFMPLYYELEPASIYVVMFLSGLVSSYMIRGNGHYKLSYEDKNYEYRGKKNRITYIHDKKTLMSMLVGVLAVSFLVIQSLSLIYPAERFQENHSTSSLKSKTMDTMENLSLMGLMGLFNYYPNTGGMVNGTLGGVSAVRLDYEPDLTLVFTPYTQNRIYFKTFTGADYLPYNNRWKRQTDVNGQQLPETVDETTRQLKYNFQKKQEGASRGKIKITNEAAAIGVYLPYYSEDINQIVYPGQTQEYTYYPNINREDLELPAEDMTSWLRVPEDNLAVIADFCQKAGLESGDWQQVSDELAAYYQDNIPYTYRPGITPHKKDFINYFLGENKRGYCAHFASAATLIFRYLGIPARYVEGYAVDPIDISEEGTLLSEEEYGSYYEGENPLGESAVVSVKVTDANAHAWVEVYDVKKGWQVVEVTPASDEEEPEQGLWQRILNFLGSSDTQEKKGQESDKTEGNTPVVDEQTRHISGIVLEIILGILLVSILGQKAVKTIGKAVRYRKADRNEKIVLSYQDYIAKIATKKKEFRELVNYEQQVRWLVGQELLLLGEEDMLKLINLLEQAGFSDRELSLEQFQWMKEKLSFRKRK